ncbi:hypothetical protein C8R45DRAFT_1099057 [Mycena sanguinolenta]|nr:hypothetical protein C8R45DRAFT_1099057 [Mycena sanguinolenta]
MVRKHIRPPSSRVLQGAINAPPSPTDGVGGVYTFRVNGHRTVKVGKAIDPVKRKAQWARQCQGEQQEWVEFYWEVPFARKFEHILHVELKCLGAWLGRVRCRYCGKLHQEKYNLKRCGGMAGLVRIAEAQLVALGWSWRR